MKTTFLTILVLSFLHISCGKDYSGKYTYHPPEQINDGIEVGTLDEVGIDGEMLAEAINKIYEGKYKEVHSILIYKDEKLVLEEYFQGHEYKWDAPYHHGEWVTWDRAMLHDVKSVTKSITSTCIGIAIDNGFIESVHQSVFEYLPDYQHLNTDGKDKISIEHLLTMTAGLEWDEWGTPLSNPENDIIGLWFHYEDPITGILERPMINEPGSSFTYSGGNMIVLGEIIKNATKMEIDEFSKKYLFEPIGSDSSNWSIRFKNGMIESAGGLEIVPRDMLKIGVTFLNRGVWNGKRIVSEQWVEKSAAPYAGNHGINIPGVASGRNEYSYSWWIKSYSHSGRKIDMYSAGGWGGQYIMVIPELNTVVVFTGGNYVDNVKVFKILKKYILPAIH